MIEVVQSLFSHPFTATLAVLFFVVMPAAAAYDTWRNS